MLNRAVIKLLVGSAAAARAEAYVAEGRVVAVARSKDGSRVVGHVVGSSNTPYAAVVELDEHGTPRSGRCSCPVAHDCKHVAATLFALLAREEGAADAGAGSTGTAAADAAAPEWERALAPLLGPGGDAPGGGGRAAGSGAVRGARARLDEVALHVELVPADDRARRLAARTGLRLVPRVALRPLVRGRSGRWVRTGISWRDLRYRDGTVPAEHLEVLRALDGLAGGARPTAFAFDAREQVHADELPASALWALLDDARRVGLPLVGADRAQSEVVWTAARSELVVSRVADGLLVEAEVHADVPADDLDPVGRPAGGVVGTTADGALLLGRLATALDATATDLLLREAPLVVPDADAPRFLRRALPALAQRFDEATLVGVALPEPPRPVLLLRVVRHADHVARLSWHWRYVSGEPPVVEATYPAGHGDSGARLAAARAASGTPDDGVRDVIRERAVLERLDGLLTRPVEDAELRGLATADFFGLELPDLAALADGDPDLEIEAVVDPDAPADVDYREAADVEVSVEIVGESTTPTGGRDWFDLGVLIRAGGHQITFEQVFRALATGRSRVLLPDGLHFSLDDERFDRLRELVEESRDLQDTMGKVLRVGRYQADLFAALDALGLVDAQAGAWRAALGGLAAGASPRPLEAPAGLAAQLRPYQQEGFEWLAFLAEHGLGGVLADDMGLGKTVQTLAAVVHAHEVAAAAGAPRPAPVLVVAPTSVVDMWETETARFAPGLRAAAVRGTRARRGEPLGDTVAGADVVVTSYALFRLDAEEYRSIAWSMLVLDEAQFVKNRQSVVYKCARELPAATKIALTGTPLENNLMELWSILSVVSPGLFPDPYRFSQYFAGPIEREGDDGRLAVLRRRVAPFVLRRTKEAVAKDLPPRQEQITEVVLAPRHRRAYDRYLQRERRNVLGLVDELETHRFKVFRSLTVLRQAALDVSLVDDGGEVSTGNPAGPRGGTEIPSSKLDVLFEMLDDVLAEGHNVLIFSQFTRYLGLVRDRLDDAGVDHAYLDGSTRRRAAEVAKFTSGRVPVFLVSLKAGGFGLNLTAADYCVLLDPWWNPAAEAQAVDRAHRIGQTRTVMVYRLVAQDTIEDKVMRLKEAKSALFASVLDGGTSAASGLTADDVRELLS
ncbi:DEAD/DEAH box helicase [Luteimicrobium subarcticum]|uniref:SNF2 family DNA or RNA helicase n=1 Tax=Luteimicrobium subarcticum TaxID=620910 RepID=A0A2M8WQY3_9MICO|nr:DEAD/DEAH box helicase [Luteimicrobium subarcticum]PJI93304.1 SNF2 family DNA or RNA helicase [Luteimicrobium subarcticum]